MGTKNSIQHPKKKVFMDLKAKKSPSSKFYKGRKKKASFLTATFLTINQDHRMADVGREGASGGHLIEPSLLEQGHLEPVA